MTTAYWWQGDSRVGHVPNFGDSLTPILLEKFAGVSVGWAPPEEADIVCVGSVLDVLPRSGWHGIVTGAGQLHPETVTDLTFATVLAVRGEETRIRVQCGKQDPILGDPGLLVSELVTPIPNAIEIGVLPHWSDKELFNREMVKAHCGGYAQPTLIDPTWDTLTVAQLIGSCRKVVASSLHGIIAADAFGIPRRAEKFPAMFTDAFHEGKGFKWEDYGSSLGQPVHFGVLQTAPPMRVERMQYELFEMFQVLGRLL